MRAWGWALMGLLVAACGGGDGGESAGDTGGTVDAPASDQAATPADDATAAPGPPATKASFGCRAEGDPPCVFDRAVPDLSCATSYEKGYTAELSGNQATIAVKEDAVEAWVTGPDAIEGFYRVRPGFCCEGDYVFRAAFVDASLCTDFETPDCDPVGATGCPDQQHCVYDDKGLPVCANDGTVAIGEACSGGACQAGTCLDLSGTGARCYRFCKTQADCGGTTCLELTGQTWKVCGLPASAFEPCNLLAPACQDAAAGCYVSGITTQPICLTAGTKAEGDACEQPSDCAAGLHCHVDDQCHALCGTAGPPPCADAFDTCQPVYGAAGVCTE